VQWVEQVVGFSRDDRGRHRKHGSGTGVRGLCSNYFYAALYAYCQSLEGHAMTYEMKPLSCNPPKLKGLSEKLIVSHYKNNYGGAVKRALGAGSGWVLLTYSHRDKKLVNQWAADHNCCLAGGSPILALDTYEHPYQIDYGAKAAAYVDAFMININWESVSRLHREHASK